MCNWCKQQTQPVSTCAAPTDCFIPATIKINHVAARNATTIRRFPRLWIFCGVGFRSCANTFALLNCETRNSDLALTTNHTAPIKVRIQATMLFTLRCSQLTRAEPKYQWLTGLSTSKLPWSTYKRYNPGGKSYQADQYQEL